MKWQFIRYCIAVLFISYSGFLQAQIVDRNCKITSSDIATYPLLKNFLTYKSGSDLSSNYVNYHKNNNRLAKRPGAVYLDRTAILFLNEFFAMDTSSSKKYSSFNIHFIQYTSKVAEGQVNEKQSLIYITPDSALNPRSMQRQPDYQVLTAFYSNTQGRYDKDKISKIIVCPGTCDESIRGKYSIPGQPSTVKNDDLFFLPMSTVENLKKNYRDEADNNNEALKKQTRVISFDKNVIFRLAAFLKSNNAGDYPMIGVYFLKYSTPPGGTHQENNRQTTLSLAPIKKIGILYEADPCSFISWFKANYNKDTQIASEGGENHGTLCPNACPPGDN